MKIFMLCNLELPVIAEKLGEKTNCFGGWLDNISRFLMRDNELTICYMNDRNTYLVDKSSIFVGFTELQAKSILTKVVNEKNYDIYHIWGTEYSHSAILVSILEKKQMLDRCIVSIQGLVSVYARHYAEGIPRKCLQRRTFRDWIEGNSIEKGIKQFTKQGKLEEYMLKRVKHVIGRTNWDKACLWGINKFATYHKCNENLRNCFYDSRIHWNPDRIKKHFIFVSQCSYPVKGFHFLLEAMPLILDKYPDARIVTTGKDFINVDFCEKIRFDSYKRYLNKLVDKNRLKDKIIFKGLLTAEQMRDEYLSANVFVSPSTIENSPNSVGEAMILGCPVVASYVGGTMDMIKDKYEGYLYQPSSTEMLAYYICQIFENQEMAIYISTNARERAMITHNRCVNNETMISIYNEIVNGFDKIR